MPVLVILLALAAPQSEAERAQELSKQGLQAYQAGNLEAAEALLREAYALDASPDLLFNLARILDLCGRSDDALAAYRKYLDLRPDAQDRGLIERRIDTLKTSRVEAAVEPADPLVEARAPEEGTGSSPVPWVVGGLGTAGLITGIVFGVLAEQKKSQSVEEPQQARAADLLSQGQTFGTVRTAALIGGGLGVVVAAVLFFLLEDDEPSLASALGVVSTSLAMTFGTF